MSESKESVDMRFDKHRDEYLKFDLVKTKYSNRRDLHAFIMLDKLFPDDNPIISGASHDEIYLDYTEKQLETLTDDQIVDLVRCGVKYHYGLRMFV